MRTRTILPLLLAAACGHAPAPLPWNGTGAIQGRVLNLKDGLPLALATIHVAWTGAPRSIIEYSDASGAFSIADLPPGLYQIEVIYGDATVVVDGIAVHRNRVTTMAAELAADVGEPVHGINLPSYLTPRSQVEQPTGRIPWR